MEARFGQSTLQNYDAVLQNAIFSPQTTFYWRFAILALWLLPIGLSVAYKLFSVSTASVHVPYIEPVDYGFYPPLGLEKVGLGVALLANTSLQFFRASSAPLNYSVDPLMPFQPGTFGANTLVMSHTAVAVLDLPNPQFVADARKLLQQGESWHIKADVLATVTRQNTTVDQYREPYDEASEEFWGYYHNKMAVLASVGLFTNFTIWMLSNQREFDQTWLFLAIQEAGTESGDNTIFHSVAKMFGTWREPCTGEWNITRTTMELVGGSCNATRDEGALDPSYQEVFTINQLALESYFLPTLSGFLGPFSVARSDSEWLLPTMTATVAGMMYSRVTALNPPGPGGLPHRNYTARGEMIITSTRLGLEQSNGLLLVILVQPTLLVLCLFATWLLYAAPVDRTLGLVSILAGVDRKSLQRLSGASLSSKLRKKIRLSIAVHSSEGRQTDIGYTVGGSEKVSRDPIKSGVIYG